MAINFPANPSINDTFIVSGTIFTWTGVKWKSVAITEISSDASPQLGGELDLNNTGIGGTGNINVTGIITSTSFSGNSANFSQLNISGVSTFTSLVNISDLYPGFYITNDPVSYSTYINVGDDQIYAYDGITGGSFDIRSRTDEKSYILNNTGIGTNNPQYKLDVGGDTSVSGSIYNGGTFYQEDSTGNLGVYSFGPSANGLLIQESSSSDPGIKIKAVHGNITLEPSSSVQITNGNLVFSTSGTGIDFSATANSSGTTDSELLDDYEEGTWTPVVNLSGTLSYAVNGQIGTYTKIGKLVNISFRIRVSSTDTTQSAAIAARITDLPFTISNTPIVQGIVPITTEDARGTANTTAPNTFGVYGENNNTELQIIESNYNGTSSLRSYYRTSTTNIYQGGTLMLSGQYAYKTA